MSPRHPLAILACGFLLVACGKQPPAQTATLDSPKAALNSAKAAPDTGLERADKARIQGSANAKVWLVIASDFQCPFCRQFHDDAYKSILKDYVATGKIRVAYVNHPGSMHVHAVVSAEAAMCAAMQDRFWPMHDALFATQEHWAQLPDPRPVFDSLATSLPLRIADWRACMTSHTTRPMIDADHARSVAAGVDGTPSFFIENKLAVKGLAPYATYRDALDSALAHAGPPSGGGQHP
jgi:protein-disulfide isomerase